MQVTVLRKKFEVEPWAKFAEEDRLAHIGASIALCGAGTIACTIDAGYQFLGNCAEQTLGCWIMVGW
eukprot:SAG31_NODE_8916_length_1364_cov_1.048221_1_plen_66_part_10